MDSFNLKERRKAIRIPILNPKAWLADDTQELITISETGAFIASNIMLDPADKEQIKFITIKLPTNLGELKIPCTVVRVQWRETKECRKGFAVKFNHVLISPNEKRILDAWLTYIRNHQIIEVSKRIIEEFFGEKK